MRFYSEPPTVHKEYVQYVTRCLYDCILFQFISTMDPMVNERDYPSYDLQRHPSMT